MIKFIVVMKRRQDLSSETFQSYFAEVHAPLASKLPGLRRYVRNFPKPDPSREPPAWDAVIEFYFADRETLEASWASLEGLEASADNENLADLSKTTWSIVEEIIEGAPRHLPGGDV